MNKSDRLLIFNKYGGCCAYCGCELVKGWHVDEILPVRRNKIWNDAKLRWELDKENPYTHPERLHIDNQMPACASCNINKHSESIENFRALIQGFKKHLNEINTQYKISKRFGLVQEIDKPVVFYFETFENSLTTAEQVNDKLNQ